MIIPCNNNKIKMNTKERRNLVRCKHNFVKLQRFRVTQHFPALLRSLVFLFTIHYFLKKIQLKIIPLSRLLGLLPNSEPRDHPSRGRAGLQRQENLLHEPVRAFPLRVLLRAYDGGLPLRRYSVWQRDG